MKGGLAGIRFGIFSDFHLEIYLWIFYPLAVPIKTFTVFHFSSLCVPVGQGWVLVVVVK